MRASISKTALPPYRKPTRAYIARVGPVNNNSEVHRPARVADCLGLHLFLSDQIVQEIFPNLRNEIQVYFSANEQEGRQSGTAEVIELIDALTRADRTNRQAIIARERSINADDRAMTSLLNSLNRLIEE